MKKIIIMLISLILLTGCSATYDINIKDKKISDEIKIYTDNDNVKKATQATLDHFENELLDFERGYEHYSKEMYSTDQVTGYVYNYEFTFDEYDAMSQLRKCYKDFDFDYSNNILTIKTSNEFLCRNYYEDMNDITINIDSDYQIVSSNADTRNGNKHSWTITRNNYSNKPIEIKVNLNDKVIKKNNAESKIDLKMILVLLTFILLVIVLIVNKKKVVRK